MFVAFISLLFGLLHQSQSAPTNCQEIVRPLEHITPQTLEGRWILVAGALNSTTGLERFKSRDSAVMNWSTINNTTMHLTRGDGLNDSCRYTEAELTLHGGGYTYQRFNLTVVFLQTICPDCLVMHFVNPAKSPMPLCLLSKRRMVEMHQFEEQAECLGMPLVALMDPTKKLCEKSQMSDGASAQDGGQGA